MVRVRPLNERELNEGAKSCVILDSNFPKTITLDAKPNNKEFNFDYVVGADTSQEDIFNIVGRPLTSVCLEGKKL